MKKTISYKLGMPPFGAKGKANPLQVYQNPFSTDGKVYIPYADPFIEARCVYLSRLGAVIALTTPKQSGDGIVYKTLIASALLSQSWTITDAYTKLFEATGNTSLADYIGGISSEYNPITGGIDAKKPQSVYTQAAFGIDKSLSEAMKSDTSEIIDFSYAVDYDPEIMSRYITQSGTTHVTRNGEFFDPYDEDKKMVPLWRPDLRDEVPSRANGKQAQKVDGSFISFWPVEVSDMTESEYDYDAGGLDSLVNDGIDKLNSSRTQQTEIWQEEYSNE